MTVAMLVLLTSQSLAQTPKQVLLNKGQVAPFQGALVPHDTYLQFQVEGEENALLNKRLKECFEEEKSTQANEASPVLWVTIGVAVGLSLPLVLAAVFGH